MTIQSEDLVVEFARPGVDYAGTRFDWTSLIRQVSLRDGRNFLSSETGGEPNSRTGFGLCSEFGLRKGHGYDMCAKGERFSKIGVGSLCSLGRKRYKFHHPYTDHLPPLIATRQEKSEAVISAESPAGSPFPWRLTRTWSVRGKELECLVCLENPGPYPIETEEYCHNFLIPPGGKLGNQGASMHASSPFRSTLRRLIDPLGVCSWDGSHFRCSGDSPRDIWTPDMTRQLQDPCWWEVRHEGRAVVRETLHARGRHMDFWAKTHVMAPELFVPVYVEAGKKASWRRTWTFGEALA